MLRNDGFYTIYILQHRYNQLGKWTQSGSGFNMNVPTELRFSKKASTGWGGSREPFASFTACGKCWQETGVQGTYDVDIAQKLLSIVAEYNPGHAFRIAQVTISQQTNTI